MSNAERRQTGGRVGGRVGGSDFPSNQPAETPIEDKADKPESADTFNVSGNTIKFTKTVHLHNH